MAFILNRVLGEYNISVLSLYMYLYSCNGARFSRLYVCAKNIRDPFQARTERDARGPRGYLPLHDEATRTLAHAGRKLGERANTRATRGLVATKKIRAYLPRIEIINKGNFIWELEITCWEWY